jgi:hypothetical protein
MNYRFHAEALAEYEASIRYYRQAQPGLQKRFVAAVEGAIGRILEHPERWRMIDRDIRRCLTKTFPSRSFTPFKAIRFSSSPWRMAVESRVIGSIVFSTEAGHFNRSHIQANPNSKTALPDRRAPIYLQANT